MGVSYWFRIAWIIPAEAEEESELSSFLSRLKIWANDRDYLGTLAPIERGWFRHRFGRWAVRFR